MNKVHTVTVDGRTGAFGHILLHQQARVSWQRSAQLKSVIMESTTSMFCVYLVAKRCVLITTVLRMHGLGLVCADIIMPLRAKKN